MSGKNTMATTDQQSLPSIKTTIEATAQAITALQWTNLPSTVLELQPVPYFQYCCLESERAMELLSTECTRLHEEAQDLHGSLSALKAVLTEKRSEGQHLSGSTLSWYKSLVLTNLYDRVEVPVCHLIQVSCLPRIMIKRRVFT